MNEPLLAFNPRNPRVITPERVQVLREALVKFGDLGGIVFNKRTNRLVGGHQRIKAFSSDPTARVEVTETLAKPDPQGTTAHGWVHANGTRYSYREVYWDEDKETTAMLAANRFSGEWDWEGVSKLLNELNAAGFENMAITGFEAHELATLLNHAWTPEKVGDTPPASQESKVDKVYLTDAARKVLNGCKVLLAEADDAKTVERICLIFLAART